MVSRLQAHARNTERKIRALIVDGFSNHDWRQTTLLLCCILESAGESPPF